MEDRLYDRIRGGLYGVPMGMLWEERKDLCSGGDQGNEWISSKS